jgi:hypothetical protein
MSKKVFNLSIKDLKEILGVVKKKKRRKRNKKTINKTNINKTDNNYRSSSLHMIPSSFTPTNIGNLQSENLHLINQQLQNKLNKEKEIKEDDNQLVISNKQDDIMKLQNDMSSMRQQGLKYITDLYSKTYQKPTNLSNIQSKNIGVSNVLRTDTFDDNIDVSTTNGDESFQTRTQPNEEIPITPIKKVEDIQEEEEPQTPTNISYSKVYKTEEIPDEIPDQIPKENNPMAMKLRSDVDINFKKKVKIYTELAIKNNIIPSQKVLDSNNVSTINAAIKKVDPIYHQDNIARKSLKNNKSKQ